MYAELDGKGSLRYTGSFITQGVCASMPWTCYPAILSRWLDCDYVNLGASGSAKGEDAMADYIKNLSMDIFVYDYDYNAPSAAHLEKTHRWMFERIRKKNPKLPIIILPRPKYFLNQDEQRRRQIVYDTWRLAKEAGDENVYFIDGKKLMALAGDEGTVDNCHPMDYGFFSLTQSLVKVFVSHYNI